MLASPHTKAGEAHHPASSKLCAETVMDTFRQLDSDHDGFITCDQFVEILPQLFPGTTKEQAEFVFRSIDLDRNGKIDFEEFSAFVDHQGKASGQVASERSVRSIFNAFDADGNGTLDKNEVLKAIHLWDRSSQVTPEDIDSVWPLVDSNRDGVIDYDEFLKLVQCQLQQEQAIHMMNND